MAAITSCIAGVLGGAILLLIMHTAARFTGFEQGLSKVSDRNQKPLILSLSKNAPFGGL